MNERIKKELEILKKEFGDLEYKDGWIFINNFKISSNAWNRDIVNICFQIPIGYPGEPPYAFYVPRGIRIKANEQSIPGSYTEPVSTPFGNEWGKFSWVQDNSWKPTSDINSGSNLLNFVRSFKERFKEES